MAQTVDRKPESAGKTREELRPVQLATHGTGPLFQRDYVVVAEGARCTPEEAMMKLREDFPRFSPDLLAPFWGQDTTHPPLTVGDTMHVHIHGAGHAAVVVTRIEARALTLRTLEGHFEAGRISFGAASDEAGRLVLRIRSRHRIHNLIRYLAYEVMGKHFQSQIWATFLKRWAEACGGQVLGNVLMAWDRVPEEPEDRTPAPSPTFEEAHANER